jgi:hypothetical protein
MTSFLTTPQIASDIIDIIIDPLTNRWTIPRLIINTRPQYLFDNIDPLNENKQYHKETSHHFYVKLKEKWLYSVPEYRSLVKYFKTTKSGDKITVELLESVDAKSNVELENEKYVFKFIEKYLISEKFVYKILKEYVNTTNIKWYDLYHNSSTLKDLFRHKLKKLIISTIYEIQKNKNSNPT